MAQIGNKGFVLILILIGGVAVAQTSRPATAPSFTPAQVRDAAGQTIRNFNIAVRDGVETSISQIPSKYWTDAIQSLQPLRVYTHRANLVVVQREQNGREDGKYIYLTRSSYLLTSGVDGFTYTPDPRSDGQYTLGTGVFDYTRTSAGN